MKLYEITAKDGIKETFAVDKEWPKKEIKDYVIENPNCSYDIRTLKKINFPDGEFYCTDLYETHYIFLNEKLMLSFNDCASFDYPEDLCWSRDVGDLICAARKLEREKIKLELRGLFND